MDHGRGRGSFARGGRGSFARGRGGRGGGGERGRGGRGGGRGGGGGGRGRGHARGGFQGAAATVGGGRLASLPRGLAAPLNRGATVEVLALEGSYVGLFGEAVDAAAATLCAWRDEDGTARSGAKFSGHNSVSYVVPVQHREQRAARDGKGGEHHVTLVNAEDVRALRRSFGSDFSMRALMAHLASTVVNDWVDLGLGRVVDNGCTSFFKVLRWPSAAAARKTLGLAPLDFHITVGFDPKDAHNGCKDQRSILSADELEVAHLELMAQYGDHAAAGASSMDPAAVSAALVAAREAFQRAEATSEPWKLHQLSEECKAHTNRLYALPPSPARAQLLASGLAALAGIYGRAGLIAEARMAATEAIGIDPGNVLAHFRAAVACARDGSDREAMDILERGWARIDQTSEAEAALGTKMREMHASLRQRVDAQELEAAAAAVREQAAREAQAAAAAAAAAAVRTPRRVERSISRMPSTPVLSISPVKPDGVPVISDKLLHLFWSEPVVVLELVNGFPCALGAGVVSGSNLALEATAAEYDRVRAWYEPWASSLEDEFTLVGQTAPDKLPSDAPPFILTAVHSTSLGFLSWLDVALVADRFGIPTAPVVHRGQLESMVHLASVLSAHMTAPSVLGTREPPAGYLVGVTFAIPGDIDSLDGLLASFHVVPPRPAPANPVVPAAAPPRAARAPWRAPLVPGGASGPRTGPPVPKHAPSLVILVGIPGAGKSTFSHALERSSPGWTRLSQDDLGSRVRVERALVEAFKGSNPHVVIDRCNAEERDRQHWLDLAGRPADAACVYFPVSTAVAARRIHSRKNHPTIPEGSGPKPIYNHSRRLVVPTADEGFAQVHRVPSASAANALLRMWGAGTVRF